MSNYLITFRPVEKYFFGSENTFGDKQELQNYWVESNYYPQQSTLLGLVRYWLLLCNKALPLDKNKALAEKLIGKESFNKDKETQDFGVINSISPLFLKSKNCFFYFASRYHLLNSVVEKEGRSFLSETKEFIPYIEGFKPKDKYPETLLSADNQEPLLFKDVFLPHEQVGIEKSTSGGTKENAFFRQTSYSLKEDYEFAFVADLNDSYDYNGTKQTEIFNSNLNIGGEKSVFHFTIQKEGTKTYNEIFGIDINKTGKKVLLMSDAILHTDIHKHCNFILGETQDFRFISVTPNSNGSYAASPKKSLKFNLLKRGSILYVKDLNEVKKLLNINNYQNIGFNSYKIFN